MFVRHDDVRARDVVLNCNLPSIVLRPEATIQSYMLMLRAYDGGGDVKLCAYLTKMCESGNRVREHLAWIFTL